MGTAHRPSKHNLKGTMQLNDVIPILVTPFDEEGAIDTVALGDQISFLAELGVTWAAFGFGSEVARISSDELTQMSRVAVERAAGRMRLIGNAELSDPTIALSAMAKAADDGLDAVMVRPLLWPGVAQADYKAAFVTLAERGALPIVVQDANQHTGVDLSPNTIAELLSENPKIIAAKVEPVAAALKMSAVVEALNGAPGTIIGGAQGLAYLHELERGAAGTMPGPAFPELFQALRHLHLEGQRHEAHRLLGRMLPLITLSGRTIESFIAIQKYILVRRGVLKNAALRRPHRPIDELTWAEVDEVMTAIGFDAILADCAKILR